MFVQQRWNLESDLGSIYICPQKYISFNTNIDEDI